MPERDPRIDPRPGDTVRDRQVQQVECDFGTGTIRVFWAVSMSKWGDCTLTSWRKWAKHAEVIHAA